MNKRPILVLLTSNLISMLGAALVTLAGFSWLFVLPINIRGGGVNNPYIGLLVFIAIPIVFFVGLGLIPVGIALAKRKVTENLNEVEDRRMAWRRVGIFFAVMTVVNVVIASQLEAIAPLSTWTPISFAARLATSCSPSSPRTPPCPLIRP